MRALITGIAGFVGGVLARSLLDDGWEVRGIDQGSRRPALLTQLAERHGALFPADAVQIGDIGDGAFVRNVLDQERPDVVYHLAARTFVPDSERSVRATFETNTLGTIELLEGVEATDPKCRVLFVSSAEVYGAIKPADLPITETQPFAPMSPYAASKAAAEIAALQLARRRGLEVVIARPFNHTGPGQSDRFVCSSFARQIADAERVPGRSVIRVGNLEAERDFSDVRDIVGGYRALAARGRTGQAYDLGAGRAVAVRSILDRLLALSTAEIVVEQDPARMRPSEVPRMWATCDKIREELGWKAEIPLESTLEDLLNHWRGQAS